MPKTTMTTIPGDTNSGTVRSREPADRDDPVDCPAGVQRSQHAARDAERDDDHQRQRRQLRRVDESGGDEWLDRRPERVGDAHVAVQQAADPSQVLRHQRAVDTELMVE
jgi:hypothetical protein